MELGAVCYRSPQIEGLDGAMIARGTRQVQRRPSVIISCHHAVTMRSDSTDSTVHLCPSSMGPWVFHGSRSVASQQDVWSALICIDLQCINLYWSVRCMLCMLCMLWWFMDRMAKSFLNLHLCKTLYHAWSLKRSFLVLPAGHWHPCIKK